MNNFNQQIVLNMQIICNIQAMSRILNKDISFEYLESKNYNVLSEIQENMLIEYNNKIKKRIENYDNKGKHPRCN